MTEGVDATARRLEGVSIVGIGNTPQGELPGKSANQIAVEAVVEALDDAGIDKSQVDGLITCRLHEARTGIDTQIGALLGMRPAYSATLDDPAIIKYFQDQGAGILQGYSGEKLRKFIDDENKKFKDLMDRAGVQPE